MCFEGRRSLETLISRVRGGITMGSPGAVKFPLWKVAWVDTVFFERAFITLSYPRRGGGGLTPLNMEFYIWFMAGIIVSRIYPDNPV